ncbi:tyrosine-protein phosphatase [Kribbella sp. NPDC049174]|uniref:tyrosine-protein phosphatase n=1 Tax=Kribbella sp. NPDC049174 TaxID=3364112 RepID=UPI00372348AC
MELNWPDCLNVRDLGGLPAGDDGRIVPGALIRSDNLSRLTEGGVEAVRSAGVSRIVDVRTPVECEWDPSPFATDPICRNRPLANADDPYDPTLSIEEQYIQMVEQNPSLFAAAVGAIADAPAGAVVVHCHAGKDRSGSVVALALSLVGVPPEEVAADYAILTDRMRDHFAGQLGEVEDPTERRHLAESFTARPDTMLALLDHLDRTYGGAERYLKQGGLTNDQATRLRARLVSG